MSGNKQRQRVLLRAEYLGYVSTKLALSSVGNGLLFVGSLGAVCAALSVDGILLRRVFCQLIAPMMIRGRMVSDIACCCIAGALCLFLALLGRKASTAAALMPPALLLTPHTADQLPTEESLVRACSNPALHLKTVLLRVAHSAQEIPAEQLLRATNGE